MQHDSTRHSLLRIRKQLRARSPLFHSFKLMAVPKFRFLSKPLTTNPKPPRFFLPPAHTIFSPHVGFLYQSLIPHQNPRRESHGSLRCGRCRNLSIPGRRLWYVMPSNPSRCAISGLFAYTPVNSRDLFLPLPPVDRHSSPPSATAKSQACSVSTTAAGCESTPSHPTVETKGLVSPLLADTSLPPTL